MDLKSAILKEQSKEQALKITSYIGTNTDRFDELMRLFFSDTYRISQRAAWIVSHCADRHPQLVTPYLKKMVQYLREPVHVAVKRNTLRILQFVELPEDLLGDTADVCFGFLTSQQEPIAVKVFAMTVIANICKKEPDLRHELKLLVEEQMPYGSAGFVSRGKKVLKELKKLG